MASSAGLRTYSRRKLSDPPKLETIQENKVLERPKINPKALEQIRNLISETSPAPNNTTSFMQGVVVVVLGLLFMVSNVYKLEFMVDAYRHNVPYTFYPWQKVENRQISKTNPLILIFHTLLGLICYWITAIIWCINDRPRFRKISQGKLSILARTPTIKEIADDEIVVEAPSMLRWSQFISIVLFLAIVFYTASNLGNLPSLDAIIVNGCMMFLIAMAMSSIKDEYILLLFGIVPTLEYVAFVASYLM